MSPTLDEKAKNLPADLIEEKTGGQSVEIFPRLSNILQGLS